MKKRELLDIHGGFLSQLQYLQELSIIILAKGCMEANLTFIYKIHTCLVTQTTKTCR